MYSRLAVLQPPQGRVAEGDHCKGCQWSHHRACSCRRLKEKQKDKEARIVSKLLYLRFNCNIHLTA